MMTSIFLPLLTFIATFISLIFRDYAYLVFFISLNIAVLIAGLCRNDKKSSSKQGVTIQDNSHELKNKVINNISRLRDTKSDRVSIQGNSFDNGNITQVDKAPFHLLKKRKGGKLSDNHTNEYRFVLINYCDSKGKVSTREIDVKTFDGVYIKAYCHSKGSMRTFKAEQVINYEVVIRRTGEVVTLDEWLRLI